MEEVAFAVVSTPYTEWDFYSATTVSSLKSNPRFPSSIKGDYTATFYTSDCSPPQSLGLLKLEDERSTSIETDPCIVGLEGVELAERLQPVGEQSSDGSLVPQRTFKCQSLNPATGRNCNITYSRHEDLIHHAAFVHYAEKHKLRCSFCSTEETFPRKSSLTRHMKSTHPGIPWSIRPSQCPVCRIDNEQFKEDTGLNIHMADSHPDVTWPHPTPPQYSRLALSRGPRAVVPMNI